MTTLVGRWRLLPSGTVFLVKRVIKDPQDRGPVALCRIDARCWMVPAADLEKAREAGLLQYLGRA